MCRTQRTWSRKFVQFNLWATLYCSWFLGLFPFIYVSRARRLKRSWWLVGYGIILNVVVTLIALRNYALTETGAKLQIYRHNPLAYHLNRLHNVILLITLLVTYFRNWWVSGELGWILNQLLKLHYRHFVKFNSIDCPEYDNYINYKGACIILELFSMLFLESFNTPDYSVQKVLTMICILCMQVGVLLVGEHFHLAVTYIYRSFWIINREFLRLFHQLSVNRTTKSIQIEKLHYLYKQLLEINRRLVAIYDYQITLILVSLLGVNIISPFFIIVYTISLKNPISIFLGLNFLQAITINVLDIWLNFAVCDLAVRVNHETLWILRLFNDVPVLSADLERSLSDFAIFSSHQRLKFNHFGMFDVHTAMGFRMIVACIIHLVCLVQFDFMNI